jgi:hypothetical protein
MAEKEYFFGSLVGVSLLTSVIVLTADSGITPHASGCGFSFATLVLVMVAQLSTTEHPTGDS